MKAFFSRMQLTLHTTRPTPHGASRLVQEMSAWSVKTRRAPSRHRRDARLYGHRNTAMHDIECISAIEYPPSPPVRFPTFLVVFTPFPSFVRIAFCTTNMKAWMPPSRGRRGPRANVFLVPGMDNTRKASMFPRDPSRCTPSVLAPLYPRCAGRMFYVGCTR